MNELIFSQIPVTDLINQIVTEVEKRINKPEYQAPVYDEIGIDVACQMTGYKKSTIYRMTFNETIPFSKMGKRLVFSRKDLSEWMRVNSVRKSGISSRVTQSLMESASQK
jgi:excisionase family DNA binding protein